MGQRRTPIEMEIARQTERQARYEAKRRQAGQVRVAVWVPDTEEARQAVHDLAKQLRQTAGMGEE